MDLPCLRGLYDTEDESIEKGLVDNSIFTDPLTGKKRMLRFPTKAACLEFMKLNCRRSSNPDFPWMQQIFSMLVTWEQVQKYLVEKLPYFDQQRPAKRAEALSHEAMERNTYLCSSAAAGSSLVAALADGKAAPFDSEAVLRGVKSRLDMPFHKCLSRESTLNTLRYLFFHMRCGIFVMMRDNKLAMFIPFANKDYRNDWPDDLVLYDKTVYPTDGAYRQDKKSAGYRPEKIIPQGSWWANGNIICNEHHQPGETHSQVWGDQFMSALRDLLEESCRSRTVADCEFFINKRDYPHLKFNPTSQEPVEPYGFIYDKDDRDPDQDIPLRRHHYASYAPIVSFYCSSRFSDLPFPTSEDWEAATGMVFPPTFSHNVQEDGSVEIASPRDLFTEENFRKFACNWEDKIDVAFFRGTATGGGTTAANNQRLHLSQISHDWSNDANLKGRLDAAITGWNLRDKKIAGEYLTFLDTAKFKFKGGKENFTPIYLQSKYKYLVYVEGHCAACRYGFMMRLGSVIIKVESSCVADSMWYFPLLQPWVDHVPVKADLSDLAEKLDWVLAANAQAIYNKYVAKEAALDYVQMISYEINARTVHPPKWWEAPPPLEDPPQEQELAGNEYCWQDRQAGIHKWCCRCADEIAAEKKDTERKRKMVEDKSKSTEEKNKVLRARMIARAKEKKERKRKD